MNTLKIMCNDELGYTIQVDEVKIQSKGNLSNEEYRDYKDFIFNTWYERNQLKYSEYSGFYYEDTQAFDAYVMACVRHDFF